ncbi:MAG: LacI family DNA-binding transcriptional regulator, partial [Phycisphaerae bacterium]|nr:LacI family DNA-binding transcriptional regulator [Phycisphaerae bacterium]
MKMPYTPATIYDVARHANVSVATVSRVFSGKDPVAEKTRKQVLQVSKKLRFKTNPVAAGLRRGRSNTISLILPQQNSPEFIKTVQQIADLNSYTLLLNSIFQQNPKLECQAIKKTLENHVSGIIWKYNGNIRDYIRIMPLLKNSRTPVVLLESGEDFVPNADLVFHDTRKAFQKGLHHLQKAGYRTFYYLHPDDDTPLTQKRVKQYQAAAKDQADHVLPCPYDNLAAVLTPVREKAKHEPIGLLIADDATAVAVVQTIEAMGLIIPQDVGLLMLEDGMISNRYRTGQIT